MIDAIKLYAKPDTLILIEGVCIMLKTLMICLALLTGAAYGNVKVWDRDTVIGEVWTERSEWKTCEDEPDQPMCLTHEPTAPIVCMEYKNDAIIPIACTLTVSALLAEPFTGFSKKVTDHRDEVVFYNQCHEVCFNFGKDRYNAWFLIDISEPIIDCKKWDQP